jgi:hypothetical protein
MWKTLYGRISSVGVCTAFGRTGPAAAVCRVCEGGVDRAASARWRILSVYTPVSHTPELRHRMKYERKPNPRTLSSPSRLNYRSAIYNLLRHTRRRLIPIIRA